MVNRISFSQCMQKHSDSVGRKKHGSKIFLTYHAKKGWNVTKLNICQLFLRKVFGLYKSTHSKTIYRAWNQEVRGQNEVLDKNIAHICRKLILKNKEVGRSKASAKQPFNDIQSSLGSVKHNPQKDIVILGNTELNQADIVCFGLSHVDQKFHENMIKIINEHSQEGDIFFIEGGVLPELEKSEKWGNLKKGIDVRVWESDLEVFYLTLPSYDSNHKKLLSWKASVQEIFPKQRDYAEQDVKTSELKFNRLCQESAALAKTLNVPQTQIQKSNAILRKAFDCLLTKQFEGKEVAQPATMALYLATFVEEILWRYLSMPEGYCNPEELKTIYKSIIPRNRQMMTNIQQGRKEGKRVWVEGGAAHFMRMPIPVPEATKEINEFLKDQRFALITTPDLYHASLKA